MCVSWCLRCTGLALIPLALVCALSNILLLLPELDSHFLLDGHVTREATWGSGLWGAFLVRQPAREMCHPCGPHSRSVCVRACVCVWVNHPCDFIITCCLTQHGNEHT